MDCSDPPDLAGTTPNLYKCQSSAPKAYKCDSCDFKTDLRVSLINHVKLIHRENGSNLKQTPLKRYYCGICDLQTYSLLVMMKHAYKNSSKGSHKCGKSYTQIDYSNSQIVEEHAYSKHGNWFKYEQCNYGTTSRVHKLKKNLLFPHETQCEYCIYKTRIKNALKIHIKMVHLNPHIPNAAGWNKCRLCPYEGTSENLKKHYQIKHTKTKIPRDVSMDKWIECKQCHFKCKLKEDMKIHREKYPLHQFFCHSTSLLTYKCASCHFITEFKLALTNHVKAKHKQGGIINAERSLFKLLVCDKCSFQTFSQLVFMKHSYSCKQQIKEPEMTYQCEKCPSFFKREGHLKNHVVRKHGYVNFVNGLGSVYPLQCTRCGFRTNTLDNLKQHMKRSHLSPDAARWRKCELCPFKCVRRCDFDRHYEKRHTPLAVTFRCSCCEFTTNIRNEWDVHKKTHVDEGDVFNLIQCELCSFTCRYKCLLKRHKLKHAGISSCGNRRKSWGSQRAIL